MDAAVGVEGIPRLLARIDEFYKTPGARQVLSILPLSN